MSNENQTDDFFDKVSNGPLPSAKLSNVDDFVYGEIVDQFKTPKKKYKSEEIEKDSKTGEPILQLVVVLQTSLRNWEGVSKIPLVDYKDPSQGELPASADEGRRAVYVAPWTNIHSAIGKAIVEATGQKGGLKAGGSLGVKITRLEDTGKGNPLRHHGAKYEAPAAGSDFFASEPAASTPTLAQAEPQSTAVANVQAAKAETQASQDPWANAAPTSKPPF